MYNDQLENLIVELTERFEEFKMKTERTLELLEREDNNLERKINNVEYDLSRLEK